MESWGNGGLGDVLVKHKSKLQLEKEAWTEKHGEARWYTTLAHPYYNMLAVSFKYASYEYFYESRDFLLYYIQHVVHVYIFLASGICQTCILVHACWVVCSTVLAYQAAGHEL